MKKQRNIALLLAGGIGSRLSEKCPKQFIEIDGESVLLHTMRAFQQHPDITDIHTVCTGKWNGYIETQAQKGQVNKWRGCIPSGETAFQSIRNGINALLDIYANEKEYATVLVHDAVRPLISYEIISRNIQTCHDKGNAITAVYSNEAYMCTEDGAVSSTYIPREKLMRAQTPHTFPLRTLEEILSRTTALGIKEHQSLFTLCNEIGAFPLYIVNGDTLNFKLTEPNDIKIYQALKDLVW